MTISSATTSFFRCVSFIITLNSTQGSRCRPPEGLYFLMLMIGVDLNRRGYVKLKWERSERVTGVGEGNLKYSSELVHIYISYVVNINKNLDFTF